MLEIFWAIFLIFFAYLMGSLSSAIIVCKLFRLGDPRQLGSRNPGTTNVLRIGGKKVAGIVFLCDFLKGWIPVFITRFIFTPHFIVLMSLVGFAAVLGHIFPLFFKFKGGKGVATSAGVLMGLSLPLGLLAISTWVIIALLFRYSSLAAIFTTVMMPIFGYIFIKACVPVLILMAFIILLKHYVNIKNLVAGKEPKIGNFKK